MTDLLASYGLPAQEDVRAAFVRYLMRPEVPAAPGKANAGFVAWVDPTKPWRPQPLRPKGRNAGTGTAEFLRRLVADDLTPVERRALRDTLREEPSQRDTLRSLRDMSRPEIVRAVFNAAA